MTPIFYKIRKVVSYLVLSIFLSTNILSAAPKSNNPYGIDISRRKDGVSSKLRVPLGQEETYNRIKEAMKLKKQTNLTETGNLMGKLFNNEGEQVKGDIIGKEERGFLVFYDINNKPIYSKDGKEVKIKLTGKKTFHGIYIIEDNPFVKGFASKSKTYISRSFVENSIAIFHELKETYYARHPEELPEGINSHTYLRGCGKDVREAYKNIVDADNMTTEELIEALKKNLSLNRQNEVEFNLIRYNAQAGKKGIKLLYGLQDITFGAESNEEFTREIKTETDKWELVTLKDPWIQEISEYYRATLQEDKAKKLENLVDSEKIFVGKGRTPDVDKEDHIFVNTNKNPYLAEYLVYYLNGESTEENKIQLEQFIQYVGEKFFRKVVDRINSVTGINEDLTMPDIRIVDQWPDGYYTLYSMYEVLFAKTRNDAKKELIKEELKKGSVINKIFGRTKEQDKHVAYREALSKRLNKEEKAVYNTLSPIEGGTYSFLENVIRVKRRNQGMTISMTHEDLHAIRMLFMERIIFGTSGFTFRKIAKLNKIQKEPIYIEEFFAQLNEIILEKMNLPIGIEGKSKKVNLEGLQEAIQYFKDGGPVKKINDFFDLTEKTVKALYAIKRENNLSVKELRGEFSDLVTNYLDGTYKTTKGLKDNLEYLSKILSSRDITYFIEVMENTYEELKEKISYFEMNNKGKATKFEIAYMSEIIIQRLEEALGEMEKSKFKGLIVTEDKKNRLFPYLIARIAIEENYSDIADNWEEIFVMDTEEVKERYFEDLLIRFNRLLRDYKEKEKDYIATYRSSAAMKSIGFREDSISIPKGIAEFFKEKANALDVKAIRIKGESISAKFIEDDKNLPKGVWAYHFIDTEKNLVIVHRSTYKDEAIYHEAREAIWIEELNTRAGPLLGPLSDEKTQHIAHILASAEQSLTFREKNKLTPYHEYQIQNMNYENLEEIINENRERYHYVVLNYYFGINKSKFVKNYEKRLKSIAKKRFDSISERINVINSVKEYGRKKGPLRKEENIYKKWLVKEFIKKGFSNKESKAVSNALVRLYKNSLDELERDRYLNEIYLNDLIKLNKFDISDIALRLEQERKLYSNKGFSDKQIFDVLFESLFSFRRMGSFLKDGLSEYYATRIVKSHSNPELFWKDVKPIRDILVKDWDLSNSEGAEIVLKTVNPLSWWEDIKRDYSLLIEQGVPEDYAKKILVRYSLDWRKEAKPFYEELINKGYNPSDVIEAINNFGVEEAEEWLEEKKFKETKEQAIKDAFLDMGDKTLEDIVMVETEDPKETKHPMEYLIADVIKPTDVSDISRLPEEEKISKALDIIIEHLNKIENSGELTEKQYKMIKEFAWPAINNASKEINRLFEKVYQDFEAEKFNVGKIIEEIVKDVEESNKNIDIKVDIPQNLSNIEGMSDNVRNMLKEITHNAIKYRSPDRICKINIKVKEYEDFIEIEIEDNGQGIGEEHLSRIFEEDYMEPDLEPADFDKRSGLGLSMVKELVQKHGGEIIAESEGRDKGSKFTITLAKKFIVTQDIEKEFRKMFIKEQRHDIGGPLQTLSNVFFIMTRKTSQDVGSMSEDTINSINLMKEKLTEIVKLLQEIKVEKPKSELAKTVSTESEIIPVLFNKRNLFQGPKLNQVEIMKLEEAISKLRPNEEAVIIVKMSDVQEEKLKEYFGPKANILNLNKLKNEVIYNYFNNIVLNPNYRSFLEKDGLKMESTKKYFNKI